MTKPPSLPVVAMGILPGEGWAAGVYRVAGDAIIFNTWKPARRRIAVLKSGAKVIILSGLSEVLKPDLIAVTAPLPDMQLRPGDTLLRYTQYGEGWADFWANGRWYANADGSFVGELDGSGCHRQCKARELKAGVRKWWFRVRLPDRRLGWTDAFERLNPYYPD
jgi:hypothetical protein